MKEFGATLSNNTRRIAPALLVAAGGVDDTLKGGIDVHRLPLNPYSVGDKINRWTIIGEIFGIPGKNKTRFYYPCRCICGRECNLMVQNIRRSPAECYCKGSPVRVKQGAKHGQCYTRMYHIWQAMLARCNSPSHNKYRFYGGKGVTVCDEWRTFIPFHAWATQNGYADDLTIDRIDSSGNYEPANCRWATWEVQRRNTSGNRFLTAFGETKCIAEWLEDPRCVVSKGAVSSRLKYGWCDEEAITVPVIARQDTRRSRADRRNLTIR